MFHGNVIPYFWLKVDVAIVHMGDIPLMHPHEANDQVLVQHVLKLPPYGTRNM